MPPGPSADAPSRWSALPESDRGTLARSLRTRWAWLGVCVVVLAAAALLSLLLGSSAIAPSDVWQALVDPDESVDAQVAVREVRVPRTVLGLLVGAAMGAAGALMQGVTRNPLADPGILGVNAGASLFVIVAISFFSITVFSQFVWFAMLGAGVSSVVVHLLGTRGPTGGSPLMMTLAGAAFTILVSSVIGAILVTDRVTNEVYTRWLVGSLEGAAMDTAAEVLPLILAGLLLAVVSGRLLNALSLGEDVARGLGQRVGAARAVVAAAVLLTCGAGTAAMGPVSFVGLLVPHLARRVTGPDHRWIVPLSALLGAAFLVLADVLGRVVVAPGVLAAGAMTALIGGPVFIAIAQSRNLREL